VQEDPQQKAALFLDGNRPGTTAAARHLVVP
jgi:hypothetical protein